jgi:hypothetical protein
MHSDLDSDVSDMNSKFRQRVIPELYERGLSPDNVMMFVGSKNTAFWDIFAVITMIDVFWNPEDEAIFSSKRRFQLESHGTKSQKT